MSESDLSQADKDRIRDEIRLTSIFKLILLIGAVVVILIILTILFLLTDPAEGFIGRVFFLFALTSLLFIAAASKNVFEYIDLKRGKKIKLRITEYEIRKEKSGFVLQTINPIKRKFDLYDALAGLIKSNEPLTIETTKLSRTLLSISQDNGNLLERVEREND